MSYSVKSLEVFERQAKRLVRKYASLKNELRDLSRKLAENPESGIPLGNHCFKIRISIASKGKGKSGGGRIITNFAVKDSTVYLLAIYDKSEKETLTDKELAELLESISE
ncbi:MAG: type II toxin-antitoxin system RelE/ParE family toxin [Prevotella sp.]|jgi:mRNA-degrading endonuclease RelE of RelBE toxin-antitoxin system|nr:type II toxin-antitoxin system RelE/ParE family toxin [Prevotella sp.]